jgi:hypothetical protein
VIESKKQALISGIVSSRLNQKGKYLKPFASLLQNNSFSFIAEFMVLRSILVIQMH